MYVIQVHYTKPLAEIDTHLVAHREHLKKGYAEGLLLASGPQNPRVGGIILAKGTDRTRLDQFLAQDPFLIHNLASYQVIEFDPVLRSTELEQVL
jgi:uncharacterized protein YciI